MYINYVRYNSLIFHRVSMAEFDLPLIQFFTVFYFLFFIFYYCMYKIPGLDVINYYKT